MMIHELKARLAERMEPLALALMATPPTTRTREELRFGRKGAMAVRIAGRKRGTWQDFSGSAGGDAIDLIRHARRCDAREAFAWARAWLGEPPAKAMHPPPPPIAPPPSDARPAGTGSLETARRLWREALPARGTLAETYLAARGLALPDDGPLRFHPRAWRNKDCGAPGPAMLALMTAPETGAAVGVHCTYIAPGGAGKAPGDRPKVMFGRAGVIKLAQIEGAALGVGEGIETCLAVAQRAGWAPIWAATSAGGIARFPILAGVEALTIFADADAPGMTAAQHAAQRWREAGRVARICAPPAGDWHDALRECGQ
jgi:hypothetical protein